MSADGGGSFTQLTGAGAPNGVVIWKIIPYGANDTDLFACSSNGFFKSSDGGATFVRAGGLPANIDVFTGVTDGTNFYIGTDRGVYTSTDFGTSFTSTLLNWQTVISMAIDTSTSPATVYAGLFGSGVWHSTDGFVTTQNFAQVLPSLYPAPWTMAVDPQGGSNPAPLYAAAVNGVHSLAQVYESMDGGVTFNWLGLSFGGPLLGMVADTSTSPTTMYAGVFAETDATVAVLSSDLSTPLFETYLGGSGQDVPWGIALDSSGSFYVGGNTLSPDFPTTAGSYEPCGAQPGVPEPCSSNGGNYTFVTKYSNTFSGSNVVVTPSPTTMVTFSSSSGGSTTVNITPVSQAAPANFQLASTNYDFTTTAASSGTIEVCISYPPSTPGAANLGLLHYVNGAWTDCTVSNNTTTGVICGDVTSLSPFNLAQVANPVTIEIRPPAGAPVSINVSSAGALPVAILSSRTFDATTVLPASISLDGAAVRLKSKAAYQCSIQDVNNDGVKDLLCQVTTDQTQLTTGSSLAVLTGKTSTGQLIQGSEPITVIPQ